jgi:hypothetical protein
MFSSNSAAQLAARVRSLIGDVDPARERELADELGVSVIDLREIVLHETPYPSVPTLAAIVAYYGVDAGWLLTGDYSPSLHRANEEAGQSASAQVMQHLRDDAAAIAAVEGEPSRVHLADLLRVNPATRLVDPSLG